MAFAFVRTTQTATGSGTSLTITLSGAATVNNLLVINAKVGTTASSTLTVTDNASTPNTYAAVGVGINNTFMSFQSYGVQVTGGATQVTVSWSGVTSARISVDEFSGGALTNASIFDTSATNFNAGSGTASVALSPSNTGYLIVAGITASGVNTITPGTGYTASNNGTTVVTQYKLSGTTSETAPATFGSQPWTEITSAFKLAGPAASSINVSDTTATSEALNTLITGYRVNTSDTVTTAESVNGLITGYRVNTTDSVAISESVTVAPSVLGLVDLSIAVSDTAGTQEFLSGEYLFNYMGVVSSYEPSATLDKLLTTNYSQRTDIVGYFGGSPSQSTEKAHSGTQSLRVETTQPTGPGDIFSNGVIHQVPFLNEGGRLINPGKQVYVSAWLWIPSGIVMRVSGRALDSSGTDTNFATVIVSVDITGTSNWQFVNLPGYTYNGGRFYPGISIRNLVPLAGTVFYVDDVSVVTNGSLTITPLTISTTDNAKLSEQLLDTNSYTERIRVRDRHNFNAAGPYVEFYGVTILDFIMPAPIDIKVILP